MIYLKEPNTNQIVEFQNEASIGISFEGWIRLNEEQSLIYELQKTKECKKQALKANRDNALNNSIYSISVNGEGCDFYLRTSDLAAIQGRINNLPNNTETMSWGCTDGRRVQLNKTAFESLYRHIGINDETVYNLYAEKLDEIENITSDGEYFDENNNPITPLQALENININFS